MSTLIRCYPGDRCLDFLLVVTLAVALASSAAWLVARRLAGKAALRHLVLLSALVCCLTSPAVAWFSAAAGVTVVSIPILRADQGRMTSGVTQVEPDLPEMRPRQWDARPPVAAQMPLPNTATSTHTNTTIDPGTVVAVAPAAPRIPALIPAMSTPPKSEVQPTGSPAATLVSFRGIATGVMFVWAAGVLMMLARLARDCGRVVHLRRSSRPSQNERHWSLLQEAAAKLGMHQVPLLLVSSRTVTPLAAGFGRSAVILPELLLGAVSDNELRDVLMHEVAHLRRGDQRIVLLQELAGALYWPIVSVHALNRELRRAREELCDNVVLAGRNAISYSETLLHVAELLVKARPMGAAAGIIGGQGELERRVAGMIDPRRNTTSTIGGKAACAVIFTFIAGVAIASSTRFAVSASAVPPPATIPAPPTPADTKPSASDPEGLKLAGHFSGVVSGPDGKPLSHARIFIVPDEGALSAAGPVRAETGADGRFEFDAPDMTYTDLDGLAARRQGLLIVTKDGYAPDWFETWGQDHSGLHGHLDPVEGAALELHLAKDDVPIHGRFLDPDGRPLAGARVRLSRLEVPRRRDLDAHLHLMTRNFAMDIMMDYERELYRPQLVPGLTPDTQTDADGRFKISGLGRDCLAELSVSAPTVVDTTLTVMTRDAPDVGTFPEYGKPTSFIYGAGFTLKLERGLTLKGRVIDRDSRAPIPGMWVGPLQNALNHFSSSLYPWVTDENGRFTITGLDPGILLGPDSTSGEIVAAAAPGLPYQTATIEAKDDKEIVIECRRGIPFHLKLVDDQGRPVEAEVTYVDVQPKADVIHDEVIWPVSFAARKADGNYEGYVLPGPGAVLVKPKGAYRPAHVDPKAFFAPGRANWTKEEQTSAYGTSDTLITSQGRYIGTTYRGGTIDQRDYAAIVLVNPPPNSGPLELSATVVPDRPRQVSLIDPEGKPVVGVTTEGMKLRSASYLLTGLDPDRVRRIMFVEEDRHLIGFLLARGDGNTPYTVRMQPWATATGRIVDENGNARPTGQIVDENGDPLPVWWPEGDWKSLPRLSVTDINSDPELGDDHHVVTDEEGRFRIDRLVPGQRYSAQAYQGAEFPYEWMMRPLHGTAFEKLVLGAGEVRDLGDIRAKLSFDPQYRRPTPQDQQAAAKVPPEAWGEPVNGLRVAIVLRSPPVDQNDCLSYDIVAENVSDHEIRFGASIHNNDGSYKIELVDVDRKQAPRQQGTVTRFVTAPSLVRFALKPKERTLISPCITQLVKLDEAGQPIPSPTQNLFYHSFNVKPGRYSVSAAVDLGPRRECVDAASGARKALSPAKGEWTGKLRTGNAAVALFN